MIGMRGLLGGPGMKLPSPFEQAGEPGKFNG
jgi:hypothetical protein